MEHDLSKLHPVMKQHYLDFVDSQYTPATVPDELYNLYLDLSTTVPDIIGKQPEEMSKKQLRRYEDKVEELQTTGPLTISAG